MADFRTHKTPPRQAATPLQPVADPAGWNLEELRNIENWSYRLNEADIDELTGAIASVKRRGIELTEIERGDFPLRALGGVLDDAHRDIRDGRGLVVLRSFPVDRLSREETAIGFLGLGTYLGERCPQNRDGHVLGHVTDLGGTRKDPNTRGYRTREEMSFHNDSTDYVGLICLHAAKSGGESRIASSVTVYNRMLESRPDLVKELIADFYFTRHGEVNPGEPLWYKQPIFAFTEGYFSACGLSDYMYKAQGLPGVPPLTPAQEEAGRVFRATAAECAVEMLFEAGDVQFLNNHVMLHCRRAYEDWPETARKRHLLRLWLNDPGGRPVPEYRRRDRLATGVRIDGVAPSAPLDVHASV